MHQQESFLDIINKHLISDRIMLPVHENIAGQVQQEMMKENPDIHLIIKLINRDPSLTSHVLRASNSTFYKGLIKISTVYNALTRISKNEILNIINTLTQRRNLFSDKPFYKDIMQKLYRHSLGCAIGSMWLAQECGFKDRAHEAFTAGLLHDIGKLSLLAVVEEIRCSGKKNLQPSHFLLKEVMHTFHPEHGYVLLNNWNLPDVYCTIARDHHMDEFEPDNYLLIMVRLANKTCTKMAIDLAEDPTMILETTPEANFLNLSDVSLAKMQIALEDAIGVSK